MTIKQSLTVLVAALGLAAWAGCVGSPRAMAPQDSTKFSVANTDKFVPLDAASQTWVSCTGLNQRTLADGRLEIVADIKNRVQAYVVVQVQCVFQDGQGNSTGEMTPWRIVYLPVDSTEAVRFDAPMPQMTKYSIRVRTGA
jgi:hypothetical protein